VRAGLEEELEKIFSQTAVYVGLCVHPAPQPAQPQRKNSTATAELTKYRV